MTGPELIGLLVDVLADGDVGPLLDVLKEANQEEAAVRLRSLLAVRKFIDHGGRLTVDLSLRPESCHEQALVLVSKEAVSCPLTLRRAPSQTRNLMEIQDCAGTVNGGIDSEGRPFGCFEEVRVIHEPEVTLEAWS